jgi:hypothetical protein
LFNGGLKDAFLAALAGREGEAVLYFLIRKHEDFLKLDKVMKLATALNLPLITHSLVQSPLCKEVLLQMLYLVLHALPIAKREQCKCIYHGLSKDDDPRVVPVLDAFTKQLGDLIVLGQPLYNGKGFWLGSVEIETPLRRLDRARVVRLGNEWNIPWELTWSCNKNAVVHCGTCPGCLYRKDAFKQEGHDDPTVYEEKLDG